ADFLVTFKPEKVYLLYVYSGDKVRRNLLLEETSTYLEEQGCAVEQVYRHGHVASQISSIASQTSSVICFVKRRDNPLRAALAGSVTSDVLRLSDQAVLVHKAKLRHAENPHPSTLMYATNLKYADSTCLEYLNHDVFAANHLIFLHVGQRAPDPEAEKRRHRTIMTYMHQLAERCADSFEHIEQLEVVGLRKENKIVRQARKHKADLLIVGKLDRRLWPGSMSGSTVDSLHHSSPCSLLVIPRPGLI
ncbi:MAG: universal stress protein, partial [Geobacteraceae bacterium]|nr:universal stress protein [Geobacteraceae bacterium]